ncbi:hypothetical protein [Mycoplasmopsis sturni]|uniref:hypothetical protein n=1 Tax=Mycoplasmopsis sturni TaxID=39047 RepID=UPI000567FE27|nr:hypothetical protein [Mycoplasmopsis sturni]
MKNKLIIALSSLGAIVPVAGISASVALTQNVSNKEEMSAEKEVASSAEEKTTESEMSESSVQEELKAFTKNIKVALKNISEERKYPRLINSNDILVTKNFKGFKLLNEKNTKVEVVVLSNPKFKQLISSSFILNRVNQAANQGQAPLLIRVTYGDSNLQSSVIRTWTVSGLKHEKHEMETVLFPVKVATTQGIELATKFTVEEAKDFLEKNNTTNKRLPIKQVQYYQSLNEKNTENEEQTISKYAFGFKSYGSKDIINQNKILLVSPEVFEKIQLVDFKGQVDSKKESNNKYLPATYDIETGKLVVTFKYKDGTSEVKTFQLGQ